MAARLFVPCSPIDGADAARAAGRAAAAQRDHVQRRPHQRRVDLEQALRAMPTPPGWFS